MNMRTDLPAIPFIDLAAQRRRLGDTVDAAITRVLNHGQYILGPEVRTFEAELAAFSGAKHVVSCASGTDALVLALRAQGIGPGDAVICPSFTFCATAEVAALVGATPVFVDVDEKTFNIDAKGIAGAIENPWEAIIVIVENNGRAHALLVDDMVSKQEVVIKPLGGFLQSLAGISGGAILGDGNIALILDPGSLFLAA